MKKRWWKLHDITAPQAFLLAAASSCAGCASKPKAAPGPGPLPVQVAHLASRPIADHDDYLASLTSRQSIELYAQVAAYVRAIAVKPGDQVRRGALLVELDSGQQEGTLANLVAARESKKESLGLARINDDAAVVLAASGNLSRLDAEQRHSASLAAESDLRAADGQVAAQAAYLRYYRITAPSDGVVGDVPVKVGDFVTVTTKLTSVDADHLLEAYVYVPLGKRPSLGAETRVALLADDGSTICEGRPWFVSPQAAVDTQTLLVKTTFENAGSLVVAQVVKARVTWATHEGLTVPASAITRQSGQAFVFVAEKGPSGALVARQRAVTLGSLEGNDFVVSRGLEAGVDVVVSNLQKVRDGAPLTLAPPPAGGATHAVQP